MINLIKHEQTKTEAAYLDQLKEEEIQLKACQQLIERRRRKVHLLIQDIQSVAD